MRLRLLAVFVVVSVIAVLFPLSLAYAQGCGTECFYTPTPTPTGSATPTPGAGTPTAVAPPSTVEFPQVEYGVPTPIPTLSFPDAPSSVQVTFPAPPSDISPPTISTPSSLSITNVTFPSPFSPSLTSLVPPAVTVDPLSFTVNITHDPFLTINTSLSVTNSAFLSSTTGLISNTQSVISDVISLTSAITEDYMAIRGTETITLINAPAEYAPEMPRPIADVGYTFEQLAPGVDTGQRFTIASWGGFFGYLASLPFQLVKALWALATRLGPLFLFLAWLLILAAIVFGIEITRFVWHVIITLIDLVRTIWETIPGN